MNTRKTQFITIFQIKFKILKNMNIYDNILKYGTIFGLNWEFTITNHQSEDINCKIIYINIYDKNAKYKYILFYKILTINICH